MWSQTEDDLRSLDCVANFETDEAISRNQLSQTTFVFSAPRIWVRIVACHEIVLVSRQLGYDEQPQNALPAFGPRLAVRLTI